VQEFQVLRDGIDVTTQISENDLFNFKKEVKPILNVLADKTLEQSLLELEEETEIEDMRKWREKEQMVRIKRDEDLFNLTKKERMLKNKAEQMIKDKLTTYDNKITFFNKALCIAVSKD